MAEETFLTDEFVRQLAAVGEVDILAGVPTLNHRATIERVVSALQVGLVKYFPRERSVLINPDGGSRDGTPEAVSKFSIQDFRTLLASSPLRTMHRITTSYPGTEGRGAALRAILAAADLLRAKACVIVSPDLLSITPEWVDNLVRPVLRERFDFVAPIYHRHKFDGLLIKNLIAPTLRAVYGQGIREPLAGEFGLSGRLACHLLAESNWHDESVRSTPDLWITTAAVVGGFRLCQSFLGTKIQASKSTGQDLVETIGQTVGALFSSMEVNQAYWNSPVESRPVPVFGFEYSSGIEPKRLNRKQMHLMFQKGVDQLASILQSILSPETFQGIRDLAAREEKEFKFPDEFWVKTVYEFAASYHHSVITRSHLLQALTPLYRGRMGSYTMEIHRADAEMAEQKLEQLGREYERLRPYLVERWTHKT